LDLGENKVHALPAYDNLNSAFRSVFLRKPKSKIACKNCKGPPSELDPAFQFLGTNVTQPVIGGGTIEKSVGYDSVTPYSAAAELALQLRQRASNLSTASSLYIKYIQTGLVPETLD